MNHRSFSILLVLAVAVTTANATDKPPFKITTKRDNDRVEVKAENDKVVLAVHSPFGVSNAVIERAGETWPDAGVLRLHLKGLENFSVANDILKLVASVSSQGVKVLLWKGDNEDSPLDAKDLSWIEIRMVGTDGKPAKVIPLKDGYFEMQLPKAFFKGNPKTIRWSGSTFTGGECSPSYLFTGCKPANKVVSAAMSTGLTKWWSNPAAWAFFRSSTCPQSVWATMTNVLLTAPTRCGGKRRSPTSSAGQCPAGSRLAGTRPQPRPPQRPKTSFTPAFGNKVRSRHDRLEVDLALPSDRFVPAPNFHALENVVFFGNSGWILLSHIWMNSMY